MHRDAQHTGCPWLLLLSLLLRCYVSFTNSALRSCARRTLPTAAMRRHHKAGAPPPSLKLRYEESVDMALCALRVVQCTSRSNRGKELPVTLPSAVLGSRRDASGTLVLPHETGVQRFVVQAYGHAPGWWAGCTCCRRPHCALAARVPPGSTVSWR